MVERMNRDKGRYETYCWIFSVPYTGVWGRWWRSWVWHCATNWKVAGLIPDYIIWIFHWHNSSSCTLTLGLTQPLRNGYQEYFLGSKGGRYVGLTTFPPSFWEPEPPGALMACYRPVQGSLCLYSGELFKGLFNLWKLVKCKLMQTTNKWNSNVWYWHPSCVISKLE
jgi:hypothetical protein